MNVLILGAGFLGKSTANILPGESVTVINDKSISDEYAFTDFRVCKLAETDKIIHIIEEKNIDTVIHFVSSIIPASEVDQYVSEVQDIFVPTIRLLEYCAQNKKKFVFISSGGAIYGNNPDRLNEQTVKEPISYYGLSKLCMEEVILFYHRRYKLEYLIIRPSNPYGYGQNMNGKQGFVAVVMGKIIKNEPIEIWGDGTSVKDYIYIDDFVSCLVKLIFNDSAWNQIYNIGSGIGSSTNDVLSAFSKAGAILPSIKYIGDKQFDVKNMTLDCSLMKKEIVHQCLTLDEGIKKYYLETMVQSKR